MHIQKIHSFFLVNLLCLSAYTFAAADVYIKEKVLAQKALNIKKMMNRHYAAKVGLTALFCVHQLTYLLPALKDCADYFFGDENTIKTQPAIQQQIPPKVEIGFFAGIIKDTQELFGTTQGWKRIGSAGFNFTGMIGSIIVSQKIAELISHPDTLRWYIHAHVPYAQTLALIETLSQKLDSADEYSPEKRAFYKSSLYLSCKQLVFYGQDVCAYMTYKGQDMPGAQKMHAERACRYLLNYQNEVFNELFTELAKENPEYGRVEALMQQYRSELKQQRVVFASIEGETQAMLNFS